MSSKPRIVVTNNDGAISIYSDIDLIVTYLDDFTDGLDVDELVTVDGEKYQKGTPDLTVNEDLVSSIITQVEGGED